MASASRGTVAGGMAGLRAVLEQEPENLSTEISPDDGMYAHPDTRHYFHVGSSALRAVRLALLAAGKDEVSDILDMGCGYGRVLRTLRAAFPTARVTASDLLREPVDFCAKTFRAIPHYSRDRPELIELNGTFDLIWCGTMLTNLNMDRWRGFLGLFASALAPGGLLVFTTHGRFVADRIRDGVDTYGLTPDVRRQVLEDYDREGFGYGDYPPEVLGMAHIESDYGISVSSPSWVCARLAEIPELRIMLLQERGWDNHQDVVACLRPSE
jgi:SAM-dependent methyltransferase